MNNKVELLEQLIKLMNSEGIDYYLSGELNPYIMNQDESVIDTDHFDVYINERDLGKFENVCQNLNLLFQDKRMDSPRILKNGIPEGDFEVKASLNDSIFYIGVYCFERLDEGVVVYKGYYQDQNNKPCCREDIFSSSLAKDIFNSNPITFKDSTVFMISPKYTYYLNQLKNPDIENSGEEIINPIKRRVKNECQVQFVAVTSLPTLSQINVKDIRNDNSEISRMIVDSDDNIQQEDNNNKQVDNSKEFCKKQKSIPFVIGIILLIVIICIIILKIA